MTTDNYTTIEEIRSIVSSSKRGWHNIIKSRTDLLDFINQQTPLLQAPKYKLSTKVYWVLNGIIEFQKCKMCDTSFEGMNVGLGGYPTYCSQKCQWEDPECCAKRDEAFKNRTPEERKRQVDKFHETCQRKYNANSWQSSDVGRKFYSDNYLNKSDEEKLRILEKTKQTNIERYGCENTFQVQEFIKKSEETKEDRYGDPHYVNREQAKQTMLDRTGFEYTFNNKEKVNQAIETKRKNYGEHLEAIVQKMEETNMRLYNTKNYAQTQKCRDKMRQTCMERYGVDSYSKTVEFAKNRRKSITSEKYPDLTFESGWELKVYDFCKMNGLNVEYQPEIVLPYEYDGRTFAYHPDFLINGRLYEVKGDHFFRTNESTGHEEMFCPYRDPEWTDEQYAWICGKYEAKHRCMLENGIRILRQSELNDIGSILPC